MSKVRCTIERKARRAHPVVTALLAAVLGVVCKASAETVLFDFETEAEREAVAKTSAGGCRLAVTNAFATSGDSALRVDFPASQSGWPSFTLRPAVTDWSEYDRLAIDLVSLGDSRDDLALKVTGPKNDINHSLKSSWTMQSRGYSQWIVPLCWPKGVPSNNITRVHFNTYRPKGFSVAIDRLTLLKSGEPPPVPQGRFFVNDVLPVAERETKDMRDRLGEMEHRLDYERFRAACYRDGVRSGGMLLGKATSMEKILPRGRFSAKPLGEDGLSVRLAQSEYESVQLIVAADGPDLGDVRLRIDGDLTGAGGLRLSATNVECHVMGYVKTAFPSSPEPCVRKIAGGAGYVREVRPAYVGWWPDPILGFLDGIDVKGWDIQSFWIRVHCPEGQKAGKYAGTVVLSARGENPVRIPLSVRVNGFSLGRTPALPVIVSCGQPHPCGKDASPESKAETSALWGSPQAPINLYKRRIDEWIDFFADYGITHDHLYKSQFGEQTERSVRRLKDQERLGLVNLLYWDMPWNGEDLAKWRERYFLAMSNAYERAKSLGILGQAHFYGCDEKPKERFPEIRAAVAEIKRAFPGIPVSTTAVDRDYGVGSPLDGVDWFCPLTCDYNLQKADASRKAGHKVWWYVCCGPLPPYANMFVECSAVEVRSLMGAQAVKFRPDGFLYYQTVVWNSPRCITSGPFTDWNPRSYETTNGDGSLVCAGPDGTPVPTIRLENFRDGLEDYAYAKILEQKLKDLGEDCSQMTTNDNCSQIANVNSTVQPSNRASWVRRARKALAVPREVVDTLANFNDDPAALYRWRDEMADLIEEAK